MAKPKHHGWYVLPLMLVIALVTAGLPGCADDGGSDAGFASDTTAPRVLGNVPTDDATGVDVATIVSITFSEAMHTASTKAAFGISPSIPGSFAWSEGKATLTFTPAATLADGTAYTVTEGIGAKDAAGNALVAPYSFNFTTQDLTEPGSVAGFTAIAGNSLVQLAWTNPADGDFAGILVLRRNDGTYPIGPADSLATAVDTSLVNTTPGAAAGLVDSGLVNGTTYYYAAFAHDEPQNYSAARNSVATPGSYLEVSSSSGHVVAVKADGTLWTWGRNDLGQVGDGTTLDQSIPIQVGTDTDWAAADAGGYHTLALKKDGSLWSWGYDRWGQLGTVTTETCAFTNSPCSTTPVRVGTAVDWIAVSAGSTHSAALKADGTIWVWGDNRNDQLGVTTGETCTVSNDPCSTVPIQLGADNDWAMVEAGYADTYAINSGGTLWGWGHTLYLPHGQVGSDSDWVSVSLGLSHLIILKSNGTLWASGRNQYGQLGTETIELCNDIPCSTVPLQIGTAADWVAASAGDFHTLALTTDGTLWAWGDNTYRALGTTSNDYCGVLVCATSPLKVSDKSTWVTISSGRQFSSAIEEDGTLWMWGSNLYGQIGLGIPSSKSVPVLIDASGIWTALAAGAAHSLGLMQDGSLWGWGINELGELGQGDTEYEQLPVQLGANNDWIEVYTVGHHSVGLKSDNSLWAWGGNWGGQVGDGTTTNRTVPTRVGTDNDWSQVSTGYDWTLAIKDVGTLWAWGDNDFGELGDGSTVNRTSPVQIGTGTNWIAVGGGFQHSVGLTSDGKLWAWGRNTFGQLGDGTVIGQLEPKNIGSDTDWVEISAGWLHTMARKIDGSLWAWGNNLYGTLGNGTTTDSTVPRRIGIDSDWVDVNVGDRFTIGLKSDGSLWAWGINLDSQLGTETVELCNDIPCSTIPMQVGTDTDWMTVSAGQDHVLARKTDGSIWAWGVNGPGKLGDGTAWQEIPISLGK